MTAQTNRQKDAVCNTCTLKQVSIAYQRAPLFRLLREPLKAGMRFLAWVYRVNPIEYVVRTPNCYGCIRFYKVALKEKSALFRWMNDCINPIFDAVLEQIVTPHDLAQSKTYAHAATSGTVDSDQADEWMKGQKVGF